MSQEPTTASNPAMTSASGEDALGALSEVEKGLQGLRRLYEERKQIENKLAEAQSRIVARETELAQREQELSESRERESRRSEELQQLMDKVHQQDEALRSSREELDQLRVRMESQAAEAQEASRAREDADRKSRDLATELDAFANELHQLQADLEKDKQELESKQAALVEAARSLKARQDEIDARLRSEDESFAERERALTERTEALARSEQDSAQNARLADAELQKRLEAETDSNVQLQKDVERLARRCSAQEEVLAEYEQLLAVERAHVHSLVEAIQTSDDQPRVREHIDELKDCLAKERAERESLQKRLAELQQARKSAPTNAGRGVSELRLRRLKRCRTILREQVHKVRKASEVLAKRFEQCEQVLSQRAALAATKRQLEVAGARIARQAAAKKAGVLTLCALGMLGILGALSWAVVGQMWPGDYAARVEITADGRGRDLSDGELDEWRRSLESTLSDAQFAETVAQRMKQRGYETLGTAVAVRALLTDSFSHESPSPGNLTLEIRTQGRDRSARTLDIISTALASDANAARERRADGAVTLIKGAAAAGAQPISDQRLARTGIVMSVFSVLTLGLGFGLWHRLSKAKQEFELGSQIDQVLDEAKWAEFTSATTVQRPGGV